MTLDEQYVFDVLFLFKEMEVEGEQFYVYPYRFISDFLKTDRWRFDLEEFFISVKKKEFEEYFLNNQPVPVHYLSTVKKGDFRLISDKQKVEEIESVIHQKGGLEKFF